MVQSSLGSSSNTERSTQSTTSSQGLYHPYQQYFYDDAIGSSSNSSNGRRGGRSTRDENERKTVSSTLPPPVSVVPYPNILDRNAVNAAVPYHGPDEAAVLATACTQSIVGSSSGYNVITIEISSTEYTASQDLLVQRLRRRFPGTIIILVVLPNPLQQIKLRLRQDTLSLQRVRNITEATTTTSSTTNSRSSRDIPLVEWLQNPNVVYPTKTTSTQQQQREKKNTELRGRMRLSTVTENQLDTVNNDDDVENQKDYWYKLLGSSMSDDTRGIWYYDSAIEEEEEVEDSKTGNESNNQNDTPKMSSISYQRLMQTVERDGNIVLYKFPLPNLTSATETTNYLHWFENIIPYIPTSTSSSSQQSQVSTSSVVLSAAGHEQVADDLRQLLVTLLQTPSSDGNSNATSENQLLQPEQPYQVQEPQPYHPPAQYEQQQSDDNFEVPSESGSWGSGDDCHLWYDTGRYDLQTVGGAPVNIAFTKPSSTIHEQSGQPASLLHKHALEFASTGTLKIYNPFSTERIIYLTYLTDDDNSYPRTRISINNVPSVIIEPFGSNTMIIETRPRKRQILEEEEPSNTTSQPKPPIPRTSAVGYIPAKSEATIGIEIVQSHTPLPFRLIGASFLATEIIPSDAKAPNENDISSKIDVEFSFEREIR